MNAITVFQVYNIIIVDFRPHLYPNEDPHIVSSQLDCYNQSMLESSIVDHAYRSGKEVVIIFLPNGTNCSFIIQLLSRENKLIGFPVSGDLETCK